MKALASIIAIFTIGSFASGVSYGNGLGKKFTEIIAFGDSTTDSGNVSQAQCKQNPPYGAADGFPLFWSPCTPLDPSDESYAYFDDKLKDGYDGRLTNGPMWVEVLADALAIKRPEPSSKGKGGGNFAYAGAKTGPDFITGEDADTNLRVNLYPNNPALIEGSVRYYGAGEPVVGSEVPLVTTQVQQYLEERGAFTEKQLVLFWSGANDLRDVGLLHPDDVQAGIANIITNMTNAVFAAASNGATQIAVLNQLNAARAPISQASCGEDPYCLAQVTLAVAGFNAGLQFALEGLQQWMLSEGWSTELHYVDVFEVGEAAIELSELLGTPFVNTTHAALLPNADDPPFAVDIPDDADDYLFWDVIHPSAKAHRIIAYRVCKTLDRLVADFEPRCFKIAMGL